MKKSVLIKLTFSIIILSAIISSCKKEEDNTPPTISFELISGTNNDGDTISIGDALHFRISTNAGDANITNFTVKKVTENETKTVLDSGLNSIGFVVDETYYQGVEDTVDWTFSIMDRNRMQSSIKMKIYKDPNSQFGGIIEFPEIKLSYQLNTEIGHFFLPLSNKIYLEDSASLFQEEVDILVYFNYKEDNGELKPSPTLSSPGEDVNFKGDLYNEYYPFLKNWDIRNYTKYDIRAENGVTADKYDSAHNDSLIIVSYGDVWAKKKYKWVCDGTIIPFQTTSGKKGLINVLHADTIETGCITFSIKMQQ
ncbi:MAG: hypothetical protein IMY72_03255 [Bacteroidetes bacterium]|nr:hypothetical protein [Bacteroidota bacterium]